MALEEADAQYDPYADWHELTQSDNAQQSTGPTGNATSSENVQAAAATEATTTTAWERARMRNQCPPSQLDARGASRLQTRMKNTRSVRFDGRRRVQEITANEDVGFTLISILHHDQGRRCGDLIEFGLSLRNLLVEGCDFR